MEMALICNVLIVDFIYLSITYILYFILTLGHTLKHIDKWSH